MSGEKVAVMSIALCGPTTRFMSQPVLIAASAESVVAPVYLMLPPTMSTFPCCPLWVQSFLGR